MNQRAKKWIKFALRWGIAVFGILWVLNQPDMLFRDRVWILDPKNHPVPARLSAYPDKGEQSAVFEIWDPWNGQKRVVPRKEVVNRPDQKELIVAYYPLGTNRATETENAVSAARAASQAGGGHRHAGLAGESLSADPVRADFSGDVSDHHASLA